MYYMKTIKQIRKEYGISNGFIAKMFGYKNVNSYNRSSKKKKVENGICSIVEKVEKKSDPSGDGIDGLRVGGPGVDS